MQIVERQKKYYECKQSRFSLENENIYDLMQDQSPSDVFRAVNSLKLREKLKFSRVALPDLDGVEHGRSMGENNPLSTKFA
uniref:Uncharacterized protein n=1 Tax=Romanomermis culicivorax TaxID=13658 RepID=A0A915J214_ROMCU